LAYLAFPGVRVIDVSDPNAPVELGAFSLDSTVYAVAAVDGLALYAASGSGPSIVDFGPEYLAKAKINIDIKPGSDSNPINLNLEGVVPVAILSSEDFNAEDVNGTTLSFGPDGASLAHWRGPHIGDVNGDGLTDLLGHFRIEDTGIAFGDTMACVSGETNDHKPFRGCDVVRTVPDMDGDLLLDVEEDAIGTHPLRFDSDGDGYGDGDEVLLMATDPLDPLDPAPAPLPGRRGIHNRRR